MAPGIPASVVAGRKGSATKGATRAPSPKQKWRACMNGALWRPQRSRHQTLPPVSRKPMVSPVTAVHAMSVASCVQRGMTIMPTDVASRLRNSKNCLL